VRTPDSRTVALVSRGLHEDRYLVIYAGGLREETLPDRRPGEVYCVFPGSSEGATLVAWGLAPKRRGEGTCHALQA
jgi:hypothetical protein